ncbi:MAG: TRAP transporter small permease subunit [Betaproteobacteria bacterium]|nr:TRAP transporter small permease subunit [Betaproteobacteria bacterium]
MTMRLLNRLAHAEEIVARACLGACAALVFVAAVSRALGAPVLWAIDIAMLLFIWCAFLGSDAALRKHQHLIIDIVVRLLPQPAQRALLIAHWTIMVVFLLTLVVLGTQLTLLNVQRPMGDTEISYAYVTAAVPVGSLLMAITAAAQLVAFWRNRELTFGGGESPL